MSHRFRPVVVAVVAMMVVASCSTGGVAESSTTSTQQTRPRRTSQSSSTRPASTTTLATTTTVPGTDSSSSTTTPVSAGPPGGVTGTIGIVGCSNTDQAVLGYTSLSSADKFSFGNVGGGSESNWGDPSDQDYSQYWATYDSHRPAGGYDAVWFQVCLRTIEHGGAFDADEQNWTSHIVEQIHLRDPGIPIWISGLNTYEDGVVCDATGVDGPAISAETAQWGAQNLSDVFLGPMLGPLGSGDLARDNCHPNSAGEALLGAQLVEFFD